MRNRRLLLAGFITTMLVVFIAVTSFFGTLSPRTLVGSLLSSREIEFLLKQRADTNNDSSLTPREIRTTLSRIIRDVILQRSEGDINNDGTVNRDDISATTAGFRGLLGAVCGNGRVDAGEQCDDGGTLSGDGCSRFCRMQAAYDCSGAPSVCTLREPVVSIQMVDLPATAATPSDGTILPDAFLPLAKFTITTAMGSNVAEIKLPFTVRSGNPTHGPTLSLFYFDAIGINNMNAFSAHANDRVTMSISDYTRKFGDGETTTFIVGLIHADLPAGTEFEMDFADAPIALTSDVNDVTKAVVITDDPPAGALFLPGHFKVDGQCPDAACAVTLNTGTVTRWTISGVCGDGSRTNPESCDDGNTTSNDGCSATCALEVGFSCTNASPNVCSAVCGDGLIKGSEACDDGNTTSNDGCSSACAVEDGYACSNTPSQCQTLRCRNGTDDDGDGGIDVPGTASIITQDGGRDIDGVMPPAALDGEWYYSQFPSISNGTSQTYVLGVWSFVTGQLEKYLGTVEGFSSGRAAYDQTNKILYQYSGPFDTRLFKVRLAGRDTTHEATYVGPGGNYGFYGAQLSADKTKLYLMFQSAQTNPVNRGPALLQEINTATMQYTRQVSITGLSSVDGLLTMVYDATRSKMYLLDQLNTNVPELRVREVDLVSMAMTGRQVIIDGDPMSDFEFDEQNGILLVVQNPKYFAQTVLHRLDIPSFTTSSLIVHDGSVVNMDGRQFTKLNLNMLWSRSSTRKLVALAHYGTSYPWSRSFFMTFDVAGAPTLTETYTDLPTFYTGGNSPEHLPRIIDSVRGVVYLEPYTPSSPTPTWYIIAPERHAVVSKTTFEFLGNASFKAIPLDWEPSRPLSMDAAKNNALILPGFTLPGGFHVWPPMRVNAGDIDCTSDTDPDEAS